MGETWVPKIIEHGSVWHILNGETAGSFGVTHFENTPFYRQWSCIGGGGVISRNKQQMTWFLLEVRINQHIHLCQPSCYLQLNLQACFKELTRREFDAKGFACPPAVGLAFGQHLWWSCRIKSCFNSLPKTLESNQVIPNDAWDFYPKSGRKLKWPQITVVDLDSMYAHSCVMLCLILLQSTVVPPSSYPTTYIYLPSLPSLKDF